MTARAEAAERTRLSLIGAMQQLFVERPYEDISLEAVAGRAGVTLQTLLRRFGSKAGLLVAAAEDGSARVASQRAAVEPGDVTGAVKNLFDHYEEWGEVSLRLSAQEPRIEAIGAIAAGARKLHADWIDAVFRPQLAQKRGRARKTLRTQLLVACDVYVWKLLRRDQGLSRADAERVVTGMIRALCPGEEA